MVRLKIDGTPALVPAGTTVLDAARRIGVEVPTFCHHPALAPFGACRLCIVEVEGPGLARTILPACTLAATEDLVVETRTERLERYRRTIVELLVSSLPPTDALALLARRFGVSAPPFANDRPDACALCGLCVRACRDRIGVGALALRGDPARPRSLADRVVLDAGACVGCGTCAVLCPIGAIAVHDRGLERRVSVYGEEAARLDLVACPRCGQPHATRRFQDLVRSRVALDASAPRDDLCPACARGRHAAALTGTALALQE